MTKPPLIIVSGPSGVGKSTLIRRLLERPPVPLRLSVSATTRAPRAKNGAAEVDGVDYHFWDRRRFERARERGEFLEWAEVHGNLYGTPVSEVEPYLKAGVGVILDIDVQGANQVRARYPEHLSVFVLAPDYERRLRERGTEDEAAVQRRLRHAEQEMKHAGGYTVELVNDDLNRAVEQFRRVIEDYVSGKLKPGG